MHRVPKILIELLFNPTINRTLHVQQRLLQIFVCNAEDEEEEKNKHSFD